MPTPAEQHTINLSSLRCAAGTDVGMRRDENQDSFGIIRHEGFHAFFVADGMGGVKGGAIASRLAISTLRELLPVVAAVPSPETITEVVSQANTKIFEQGASQPGLAGMGTTLTGLVFTPFSLITVNVGDSRIYRVRAGEITRLSEDHTLVRELLLSGAISEKEAQGHPVSHMLTRSLGPLEEVAVDCRTEPEPPLDGDVFVLCSDGLYNFVQDNEIAEVISQNPLDDANQILINLANRRGGADNITVVVISVGERPARGRGGEYRAARGVSPSSSSQGEVSGLTMSATSRQTFESEGLVSEEIEPIEPPVVEEPRDYHAERERIKKARRRQQPQERRSLPAWVMISSAVIFGLLVGDVTRHLGGFSAISSGVVYLRGALFGARGERETATSFEDLSRELSLSRSRDEAGDGLVDIIKRVQGEREGAVARPGGAVGSESLSSPRVLLERAVTKLERQIADLSTKPPGGAVEALRRAVKQEDALKQEISAIEEEIGAASRKLSLWYGRRARLQAEGQDILSAKDDLEKVAASSEVVRRKLADYTEANYRFQAKRDEFELYPANSSVGIEVDGLKSTRDRLGRELQDEVSTTVERVLSDSYKQLEELRARRTLVDTQLQLLLEDSEFLAALADPDPSRRDLLREKLQAEIIEAREALATPR